MPDTPTAVAPTFRRAVVPLLGACLLLTPAPVTAENSLDDTLKSATEALSRTAIAEAARLHGKVIDTSGATRIQRA
ncbi:MAG: hypothetical protein HQM00_05380, partial [Magnetococcales bacterium]|nr:hypothetical protein [Magnetococcales bacterium]